MTERTHITDTEQELIEATGLFPNPHHDRQNHLVALLQAVGELTNDEFDRLSDEAAEWANDAVDAYKQGNPVRDFAHGGNGHDKSLETGEPGPEASPSAPVEELQQSVAGGDPVADAEGQEPSAKRKKATGTKRAKGDAGKKVARAKKVDLEVTPKKPRLQKVSAEVNQWGVLKGTKADMACMMAAQEGGTTMKDIKEATGDVRYNLFNRLQRRGFKVERGQDGRIKLY